MRENRHPTLKNPTSRSYGFRKGRIENGPNPQTLGILS
ncbi:MAG: hypothetical protein RJA87_625 [Pseudomonadota bacterium]|jgi:hypothetical protein